MNRETELQLIDRLLAQRESGATVMEPDESRLPVSVYRSQERFDAEQRILVRKRPTIVAHASELASPGDFLTHDSLGVPLLILRDRDGVLRAFLNVCRHRGSRLVLEQRGSGKKGIVCGYHGWTYGMDGGLLHIPHPEGFPRTDCDRGLVPVGVEERAGFIWVLPEPRATIDVAKFLGPLDDELRGFDLAGYIPYRTEAVQRRFNWKLIIDAFLDGYHLRQLHRNSVYRFFIDNLNIADSFPPHIRSIVARKGLEQARNSPRDGWRLNDFMSLTYFLFPNTVLVFHPDWVSRITLFPVTREETIFAHTMLIPSGGDTEEKKAHWDKTWVLIHGTVFQQEDLAATEWIQSSFDSGANDSFALGRYEFPIRIFHESVEKALSEG